MASCLELGQTENWKVIDGYPNYLISNLGRIKSVQRVDRLGRQVKECFMRISTSNGNRSIVTLSNCNGQKTLAVSSLVAKAFLGSNPDGLLVCHKNGNSKDDRESNLRYDTQAGNCADKLKHGTYQYGQLIGTSKLTEDDVAEIRKRFAAGQLQSVIARDFNTSQTNISSVVRRETWRHCS